MIATLSRSSPPASSYDGIISFTKVHEGLDFILSHFTEPIWPRTISTRTTKGTQVLVFSKQEALARYRQANLLDCRISAFPNYTVHKGTNIQAPDFVMIDSDLGQFKSREALDKSLQDTIIMITETFTGTQPSVIWTGSGYHVYVPLNAFVLEQEGKFKKFDRPSLQFLRFTEWHLSNGESDPVHNATVSFKNCMLRIPGSYNSKCLGEVNSGVKVIRQWNNHRPKINLILGSFYAYLVDRKIKELSQQNKNPGKSWYKHGNGAPLSSGRTNTIVWIERLLHTPIEDHRKFSVWRILAPYFINVKRLRYNIAYNVINDWLNECNNVRSLDFRPDHYIGYNLNLASKKRYLPISSHKLMTENKKLHKLLEC